MTTENFRPLLELAARAAGIDVGPEDFTDEIDRKYSDALGLWVRVWPGGPQGRWWNPRGNGDHALRLVVRLQLHLGVQDACTSAWSPYHGSSWSTEAFDGSPLANADSATRLAILRCAAKIGARMEPT